MSKLRVHNFCLSLDGFGAGPHQELEHPLGVGAERLHHWIFDTAYGRAMTGQENGSIDLENSYLVAGDQNIGATIMGRNMFGPIRGLWDGDDAARKWTGWWGEEPPYHHDVFVLTGHARDPLTLQGGTTFHFVTQGPEIALELVTEAAAGGASAIRQYVALGLVHTLHLAIVPVPLGSGERLFDANWRAAGYACSGFEASEAVVHVQLAREASTSGAGRNHSPGHVAP